MIIVQEKENFCSIIFSLMNFLRRPSLPQLFGSPPVPKKNDKNTPRQAGGHSAHNVRRAKSSHAIQAGNTAHAPAGASEKPRVHYQNRVELLKERLISQIGQGDERVQEIMIKTDKLRADLKKVAASSYEFAQSLAKFSEKAGSLVTSDLIDDEFKNLAESEHYKHSMLMAALHQLSKYYSLYSDECVKMSEGLMTEFQIDVKDRQDEHREKFEQWNVEYDAAVMVSMRDIDRLKQVANAPDTPFQEQALLFDEITKRISSLENSKKQSLRLLIKAERHHYVHFAHRLQAAFKGQIQGFRALYHQDIENTDDLVDVSRIQEILEKHPKPSQLYLRLKPQTEVEKVQQQEDEKHEQEKGDQDTEGYLTDYVTDYEDNHSENDQPGSYPELTDDSSNNSHNDLSLNTKDLPPTAGVARMNLKDKSKSLIDSRKSAIMNSDRVSLQQKRRTILDSMEAEGYDSKAVKTNKFSGAKLDNVRNILQEQKIDSVPATLLFDYQGQNENDISLPAETTVEVISVEGEWAYAIGETLVNDKPVVRMGWIPVNYTTLKDEEED